MECLRGCNRWLAAAAAHRAAHQARAGPAWDDFPEGLRRDIDDYLAGLTKPHRSLNGKRIRPCRPATIRTRRAELLAMARMAVRLGVPIENLTSLAALLHPDVVEPVIEAYWQKNGMNPRSPPSTSAGNCSGWPRDRLPGPRGP